MDGRSSELAEKIYSKYKKSIKNKMKKNKLLGSKFKMGDKTYIITDGSIKFDIEKIKKRLIRKYLL